MSQEDYEGHLKAILAKMPEAPLLPLLRTGYSRINVIYMRHTIKGLVIQQQQTDEEKEPDASDPVLQEMWREKGRLFRERAKLSNSFHTCQTDAQRKVVSDSIMRVWSQILRLNARIDHYEQHNSLPQEESEQIQLPDDPIKLMRAIMSLRARISQQKQRIKAIGEMPDEHPEKAARLQDAEAKLSELKLTLGYATQREKAHRTVHQG